MAGELPLAGIRCEECGYCLYGLPARGRCPECGTGYYADPCGPPQPQFDALLPPAVTLAATWLMGLSFARSAHPAIHWLFLLAFALAIVWARRVAIQTARVAYRQILAATPVDRPPPSRTSYIHVRSVLYFLTELALSIAVLLILAFLVPKYALPLL